MIRRMQSNYSSVGVVVDSEELPDISFCSTCMAVGQLNRLKERIYLDSKGKRLPTPPGSEDQFLQCWTCGNIVPTREAKLEGTIKGIEGVEILQSPYERGTVITGTDDKLSSRYQRLKNRKTKHEDPEVQRELDKGNIVTNYHTSMPT